MTNEECWKLIGVLFTTYPSANLDVKHAEAYASALLDLPRDAAIAAVERLRRSSRFLPSVAEIREAATAQQHGPRKTGAEAYGELLAAIRRHGQYPEVRFVDGKLVAESPWPPVAPDVARAMLCVWSSWTAACNSGDSEAADRARFIDAYDGLAVRSREDLVAGSALPKPTSTMPAPPGAPRIGFGVPVAADTRSTHQVNPGAIQMAPQRSPATVAPSHRRWSTGELNAALESTGQASTNASTGMGGRNRTGGTDHDRPHEHRDDIRNPEQPRGR